MRIILTLVALLSTVALASRCSTVKMVQNPPKVKFKDVRLKDTDLQSALLDIILEVENQNAVDATVDRLTYDLSVNDKPLTQGTFDQKVELPANQTTVVSVPVKVKVQDLLSSALALLVNSGTPYNVKGTVGVGLFDIPFHASGKLDLNKH